DRPLVRAAGRGRDGDAQAPAVDVDAPLDGWRCRFDVDLRVREASRSQFGPGDECERSTYRTSSRGAGRHRLGFPPGLKALTVLHETSSVQASWAASCERGERSPTATAR